MQPSSSACLSLWVLNPVPGLTEVWCSDFTGLVAVSPTLRLPVGRAGGAARSVSQIAACPKGCGGNIWGEKRVSAPNLPFAFCKIFRGYLNQDALQNCFSRCSPRQLEALPCKPHLASIQFNTALFICMRGIMQKKLPQTCLFRRKVALVSWKPSAPPAPSPASPPRSSPSPPPRRLPGNAECTSWKTLSEICSGQPSKSMLT